jgi:hypothetical protein
MRWTLVILAVVVLADAAPAAPVVRDCRGRIGGAVTVAPDGAQRQHRFHVGPFDLRVGPIAFAGLRRVRERAVWDDYVARDQWIKAVALVRPGRRVTLTVPEEQRSWMHLKYGGRFKITLVGCRHLKGPTPFSGGFDIDFAAAPQEGRCANLIVSTPGREPRRVLLFAEPQECTRA